MNVLFCRGASVGRGALCVLIWAPCGVGEAGSRRLGVACPALMLTVWGINLIIDAVI